MIDEFKKDIPYSRNGFGLVRNHYVSGRIGASTAAHGGLFQVRYIGNQPCGRQAMLEAPENSTFVNLARIQVMIDGLPYRLEFRNTEHFIFGYRSVCELAGVKLRHEMVLDRNVVFQRVSVISNPGRKKVTARLVHSSHTLRPEPGRSNCEWIPDYANGVLNATLIDKVEGRKIETGLCIGGINPCHFTRTRQTYKFYLISDIPADTHSFYIVFNRADAEELSNARIDRVWVDFQERAKSSARFHTGNAALDSALFHAPELISNLECKDIPGAFRAGPDYWVWGWDAMAHSDGLILCGRPDPVRRMLLFFKDHAAPGGGIAHSYPTDCRPQTNLTPAIQGFFVILLRHYYLLTKDEETLAACLPFAREIMERAEKTIRKGEHLVRKMGYFPDIPQVLDQTDDDFSVINNSVYYQTVCAWNGLTGEMAEECVEFERRMSDILWSEDTGFWVDSADGKTGAKREYHPCYGQLYVTPFALIPHREDAGRIAAYMKKNFLHRHGVWQLNLLSEGFMADGGQQGKYFPSTDRYYWNMMNEAKDIASLDDYERIVSSYWKLCTYPEGETNEIMNTNPAEYEDEPGSKYGLTAKSWLCDSLELNLGLRVGENGISFNPVGNGREFSVSGLFIRGLRLDVKRTGKGRKANYIFNGSPLKTGFLSWDMFRRKHNRLQVKMT